jgi:hypothetical protein
MWLNGELKMSETTKETPEHTFKFRNSDLQSSLYEDILYFGYSLHISAILHRAATVPSKSI